MRLFLLTFFLLYGGMHLYAFMKARAAFSFGASAGISLAIFMLIMLFAPFVIRLSENAGFEVFARLMSYVGYTWLGILFLYVSASAVIDIYRFLIFSGETILKQEWAYLKVNARNAFLVPLAVSIGIAFYGYFEARDIRTEHITVKSPKVPAAIERLRVVQISDVHLGLIIREERLARILKEVKKAGPDILVSTGDLVDGQIDNLAGLAVMLREIQPRYGMFAITGNHEFYAGLDQALNFTEKAGFILLRNRGVTIEGRITIAGVDDLQAKSFGLPLQTSERDMLAGLPQDRFTVLLKHRPLTDAGSTGFFDLQLSGHVHKGQIFPFSILTWLYYPTQAGLAGLPGNSLLYVSRGSGTWGPPVRFLSPPEVTVIDIVHSEQ